MKYCLFIVLLSVKENIDLLQIVGGNLTEHP